jgi:hypothetical protein
MLATWSAIAAPASATLILVLPSAVVLVVVLLVARVTLVATFGPALLGLAWLAWLAWLGCRGSGRGGRLGGSGHEPRGIISALLFWRWRRFVPA